MESLSHIKQSASRVSMVCDYHCLTGLLLAHRVIQVAASVGRQTLLSCLQNNDSDFTFGGYLVFYCGV